MAFGTEFAHDDSFNVVDRNRQGTRSWSNRRQRAGTGGTLVSKNSGLPARRVRELRSKLLRRAVALERKYAGRCVTSVRSRTQWIAGLMCSHDRYVSAATKRLEVPVLEEMQPTACSIGRDCGSPFRSKAYRRIRWRPINYQTCRRCSELAVERVFRQLPPWIRSHRTEQVFLGFLE